MKSYLFILILIMTSLNVFAQNKSPDRNKKMDMSILKDSVDGKLDVSNFLVDAHGFIPVPQLITEPALGNIGLLFAPVFIQPNKVQVEGQYIPPTITAGFVGYTANKTWGFGGMRIASLPRYHLKYRLGAVYGDANLSFYRNIRVVGEREFGFNFKTTAIFGSVLREISNSDVFIGLEYLYLFNDVTPDFGFENLPDFVEEKDLESNLSSIGIDLEFDKRDNVFTPNTGWYITTDFRVNASWTGSDYDYQNLSIAAFKFFQFSPNWISGFRLETKIQTGDAPFYIEPAISLRGVPLARYQGDQTYVLETEQRYDFTLRWSMVAFGGLAKAPTDDISFDDALLVHNYGTGFRYLIARKFGLRTGIDVAWSNDNFGWYIVFGSAWNNRN
ncbi:BamA/TamA family outer membrane protein [Catalinimonas sp. 4WD22]